MARLNDHQVVQLIDRSDPADDTVVLVEDRDGTEIQVAVADVPRLIEALMYLTAHSGI